MVKSRICPKCKSTDIITDWSEKVLGQPIFSKYACNNCGYEARIFPEID